MRDIQVIVRFGVSLRSGATPPIRFVPIRLPIRGRREGRGPKGYTFG